MLEIRMIPAAVTVAASWFLALPALDGQTVLYVDDDGPGAGLWVDAFIDLQDALDVAATATNEGTEIWVAAGTYTPDRGTGDQAAAFRLPNGVALYGGFAGVETSWDQRDPDANVAILSGDLAANDEAGGDNSDNSFHVVDASDTDSSAVLDGFTIRGGHANGPALAQRRGGGMYVVNGSPSVQRCVFVGNATSATGGSFGGGGMYLENSSPALTDCTFLNNFSGAGGGMLNIASAPTLARCVFVANESFQGGGIKNLNSSPTLVNCVLAGNSVTAYGGGLFNDDGDGVLINCTVFDNQAIGTGGGLYTTGTGSLAVTNCIVWNNRDQAEDETSQIHVNSGSAAVGYSCVQGWTGLLGGNGNIGDDPLFADAASPAAGLRLLAGSPCIDAGDNDAVPAEVTTDLGGDPRFVDDPETPDANAGAPPMVDMGAFEFQPETGDDGSGGDDGNGDVPGEPIAVLHALIDLLPELQIPEVLQDQLGQRLLGAVDKLEDQNPDNDVSATNKLEAFIDAVEAQSGKRIPQADADALVESALGVIAAIANPS